MALIASDYLGTVAVVLDLALRPVADDRLDPVDGGQVVVQWLQQKNSGS